MTLSLEVVNEKMIFRPFKKNLKDTFTNKGYSIQSHNMKCTLEIVIQFIDLQVYLNLSKVWCV